MKHKAMTMMKMKRSKIKEKKDEDYNKKYNMMRNEKEYGKKNKRGRKV